MHKRIVDAPSNVHRPSAIARSLTALALSLMTTSGACKQSGDLPSTMIDAGSPPEDATVSAPPDLTLLPMSGRCGDGVAGFNADSVEECDPPGQNGCDDHCRLYKPRAADLHYHCTSRHDDIPALMKLAGIDVAFWLYWQDFQFNLEGARLGVDGLTNADQVLIRGFETSGNGVCSSGSGHYICLNPASPLYPGISRPDACTLGPTISYTDNRGSDPGGATPPFCGLAHAHLMPQFPGDPLGGGVPTDAALLALLRPGLLLEVDWTPGVPLQLFETDAFFALRLYGSRFVLGGGSDASADDPDGTTTNVKLGTTRTYIGVEGALTPASAIAALEKGRTSVTYGSPPNHLDVHVAGADGRPHGLGEKLSIRKGEAITIAIDTDLAEDGPIHVFYSDEKDSADIFAKTKRLKPALLELKGTAGRHLAYATLAPKESTLLWVTAPRSAANAIEIDVDDAPPRSFLGACWLLESVTGIAARIGEYTKGASPADQKVESDQYDLVKAQLVKAITGMGRRIEECPKFY